MPIGIKAIIPRLNIANPHNDGNVPSDNDQEREAPRRAKFMDL